MYFYLSLFSPILKKVEENSTIDKSGFSSIVEDNSMASFSLSTRPMKKHSNVIRERTLSPTPGLFTFFDSCLFIF